MNSWPIEDIVRDLQNYTAVQVEIQDWQKEYLDTFYNLEQIEHENFYSITGFKAGKAITYPGLTDKYTPIATPGYPFEVTFTR